MKYKCTACGYIYDDNVESVKFEDLPDDWVCPLCGLGKVLFLLLFADIGCCFAVYHSTQMVNE